MIRAISTVISTAVIWGAVVYILVNTLIGKNGLFALIIICVAASASVEIAKANSDNITECSYHDKEEDGG
ncbi:MAG: hypothetical protein KAS32_31280 [Candidatus Peribacteraceae bacterium]|nr:hypothetical protein [Candidatus Peribacteraceae bacterium]